MRARFIVSFKNGLDSFFTIHQVLCSGSEKFRQRFSFPIEAAAAAATPPPFKFGVREDDDA